MPYNFIADSFHTGATAELLRAKIDRKSYISRSGYLWNSRVPVPTSKCTLGTLPEMPYLRRYKFVKC